MVKSCCVVGCVAKDVTYFRFPNSRTRCKRWMEAIKLASKPSDKSMVCSAHFHPDDYDFVRGKIRLKPKVVPSMIQSEQPKTNQANFRPSNNTHNNDDQEYRIQCDRLDNDGSNNKNDTTSHKKKQTQEKEINRTGEDVNICTGRSSIDKAKLLESVTETVKPSLNTEITITEKDDIEDILTYFHIKQNKQVVERQDAELQREKNKQESARVIGEERDVNGVIDLASFETEAKPVFIEISTDQDKPNGRGSGSPRDCLMVLESVQVDLDPSELMLPDKREEIEEDEAEAIVICDKPDDPISLLTSSDEDDVIIQEPHIETVEVSDETDEDDVPLVKLVKTKSKKKKKRLNPFFRKSKWGDYLYNCTECQYRSDNKFEYEEHVTKHSTVIHMCHICEYITASKALFTNHQKKHKEDKCYECHLCGYKARHKLSLTYHMKSHNSVGDCVESVSEREIPKSNSERTKRRRSRRKEPSDVQKLICSLCGYSTKSKTNLKNHNSARHKVNYS
ncbi:unnamed protein product [Parnassius apollo]|uniref:(apollo) hypothetical protein n=1 Tax=Parnassius apollo TaxID=110799 RepID=A0A8S3WGI8_PARAO|nr:unnamed protein product [Parnassius apollo]